MKDWAKHFQEVSKRAALEAARRDMASEERDMMRKERGSMFKGRGPSFGGEDDDDSVSNTTFGNELSPGFGVEFGLDQGTLQLVQTKLNVLQMASPPLKVDGLSGPMTTAAVRRYQASKGLTVDGFLGTKTLASLGIKVPTPSALPTVNGPVIPGMKQSVVNAMPAFNGKFEGRALPFMYTDVKGYMTTGTGNLIDYGNPGGSPDPTPLALSLDWRNPDGSKASVTQITDAWHAVKSAFPGIQSIASQSLTNIRLPKETLDSLLFNQVKSNNNVLRARFPGYVNHPADGQLGLHSISWAYGPAFTSVWGAAGPQFLAAINRPIPDYRAAIDIMSQATAHEQSINSGIVPRIEATKKLFSNAADAIESKSNFNTLFFPGDVTALAGVIAIASGLFYWFVGGAVVLIGYSLFAKGPNKLRLLK
jgi:Putative peptidoglycan binding domain